MGFIKEPEGIDFVINGEPLTESQKGAISAFITADKDQKAVPAPRRRAQSGRKRQAKQAA